MRNNIQEDGLTAENAGNSGKVFTRVNVGYSKVFIV